MKKFFKLHSVLMLFLLMGFVSSEASAEVKNPKVVTKETFKDKNGQIFSVALTKYTNHLNELEVRIEAASMPRFAANINPLLGFGRDTDSNGKIDTWFLITKNGIDLIAQEGHHPMGRDILGSILSKKYRSTFLMNVSSATTSILSYLFLSAHTSHQVLEEYYRDWMDLEVMRTHFEKDFANMGSSYTYSQYMYHMQLSSIGYKEIANRMDRFAKKTFWGYAFADLGLWITGGVVIEWGAKIIGKLGLSLSGTAFATTVKETFFSFFQNQRTLIQTHLSFAKKSINTLKANAGVRVAEKELLAALTVTTWKMALHNSLKALKAKQKLHIAVKKTIRWPVRIVKAASKEWKYIAMNSSVQLGSEAYARWDDIKSNNPGDVAKNLLTNSEVQENVGFMAAETILMTGISKNLTTTRARFMASGAVALTNSSIMNFAIKEEADIKRVAFDTGWEMLIGNAQVQMDLKALEYFEKMALKKNNPKIKLVGYVVALVDMGIGYTTYSKVTSALNDDKEPKVMLVPVLVEMP